MGEERSDNMTSRVTRMEQLTNAMIPAGKYLGRWSGYFVYLDGGKWRLITEEDIHGINIACVVAVDEKGDASVDTFVLTDNTTNLRMERVTRFCKTCQSYDCYHTKTHVEDQVVTPDDNSYVKFWVEFARCVREAKGI